MSEARTMKVYRDIAGGHRVMTVDYCLPRDPAMDMVYGLVVGTTQVDDDTPQEIEASDASCDVMHERVCRSWSKYHRHRTLWQRFCDWLWVRGII